MDRAFRRNTLILIGSLAAILILYVVVYWLPQRRRTAEMRSNIQRTLEAIEHSKQQSAQLARLNGELAQLESYTHQVAEQIPPALNVKEFLATVHSLGEQEDVKIPNVTPSISSELVTIQQQPISLTLVGQFRAIVQLMYELETMNRMIDLSDLEVRAIDKATSNGALEVKLNVRLYARPAKSSLPVQNNG